MFDWIMGNMFDWLLGSLPTWFTWTIIGAAVVIFALEMFTDLLLPYGYKQLIKIISVVLFASGFYLQGRQDILIREKSVIERVEVQERIVTQNIVKEVKVKDKQIEVVHDKIIETITVKDDSMCVLPESFVRVHNASATGIPESTPRVDGAPSGVALSDAERTIADNYEAYHKVANELTALQKWVKEQGDIK
jgi:apolipoprotein N-acyltransferase